MDLIRRILFFLILFLISETQFGQIIADHKAVDNYDQIPQIWLDEVKNMWLSYAGESHSAAIRDGLLALEELDSRYSVSVTESGEPEINSSLHLRVSRGTWGDLNNPTGWIYNYGEEDWCANGYPSYTLNSVAVERTKDGILYCSSIQNPITAFGFGWCYDDGYDLVLSYIEATKQYVEYCNENGIETTIFFTTGPIDNYMGEGEAGYINSLRWKTIRDTVSNHSSRILFDYADILSYSNSGESATATWNGNVYPTIHPENMEGGYTGHIGMNGGIKLAKAMWWMLARIAGWNGVVTGSDGVADQADSAIISVNGEQLRIEIKDWTLLPDRITLHNYQGSVVSHKDNPGSVCSFSTSGLPAGIYIVSISHHGFNKTQKIFIQ